MADRPFVDPKSPPKPTELQASLGRGGPHWTRLRDDIEAEYAPLTEKWTFSGKAYGWSLRLIQKKRTVLYMIPRRGYFVAAFALGDKACAAARASGLPKPVLDLIASAPKYAEGRGVRIEVRTTKDVVNVEKLADVKMAN
jgi:hypothetical protein